MRLFVAPLLPEMTDGEWATSHAPEESSAPLPVPEQTTEPGSGSGSGGCCITTVEEEEEVSEYVLVRFPCFDFFSDVHLCEREVEEEPPSLDTEPPPRKTRERRNLSSSSSSSPPPVSKAEGPRRERPLARRFCPEETLRFSPGTLLTSHPHLVVNGSHADGEMLFRGVWESATSVSGAYTNRAILKVSPTNSALSPFSISKEAVSAQPDRTPGERAVTSAEDGAQGAVQSLLPHAEDGVTADEKREWKEKGNAAQAWQYDEIMVPSAVLVMHRYK